MFMYIRGTAFLLRFLARTRLIPVSRRAIRRRISFRRLLGRTYAPRAVMPLLLHIVVLRQRWDERRPTSQLADPVQNDLGAPVVELDRTADLNHPSGQPPHVTYVFQVARKHHDREWTSQLLRAEVHEMHALGANFHAQHFSHHAL